MPENKVISEPVAIGAARRYLRNEQAAQKRAALSRQVTTPKGRPRETFRAFCRREGLPYSSVYKHYRSLKETGSPAVSPLSKGRPRCLTDAEDTALVAYIVELEKAGVFASIPMIVAGANKLRAMRRPPAPPVNKNWFTRWKKDHGELRTTATDPMEVSRLSWEAQSEETSAWCHGRIILDMREGNDLLAPIDEDSMVRREGSILHDGGEHGGVLWLSSSHVTYLPALLPEPSHYPALKVQFGKKN
ncbi:hypothetical protein RB593_004087 [Gaeumannomyces tritici]